MNYLDLLVNKYPVRNSKEQKNAFREFAVNEAKNLGLIDKTGNKNKAIKIAASRSKANNYTVINYPKSEKSLTETLSQNKIFNLQI